ATRVENLVLFFADFTGVKYQLNSHKSGLFNTCREILKQPWSILNSPKSLIARDYLAIILLTKTHSP
ncbi:MAG: hypothetical protein AAFU03_16045, partial [Bacteroidota bacterium]